MQLDLSRVESHDDAYAKSKTDKKQQEEIAQDFERRMHEKAKENEAREKTIWEAAESRYAAHLKALEHFAAKAALPFVPTEKGGSSSRRRGGGSSSGQAIQKSGGFFGGGFDLISSAASFFSETGSSSSGGGDDGDGNVNVTTAEDLLEFVKTKRQRWRRSSIIGIGDDTNAAITISSAAVGWAGWITLPLLIPLVQAYLIMRAYDTDECSVGAFVLVRAVLVALAVGVCGAHMLRVGTVTTQTTPAQHCGSR